MEYKINWNGESYDIPNYSLKIADKLEGIELLNRGNQKFRDKCKKMYDFICEMLTKDIVINLLGKFEDSDPNNINILYLEIVKTYNQPLIDYNKSDIEEKLNTDEMSKMSELIKAIPQLIELNKQK